MKCIELSIKDIRKESKEWGEKIKETYKPELVIYVAKGGYIIGKELSDIFGVPLLGVSATRKGGRIKSKMGPLISKIPNCVRNTLIKIELKFNVHEINKERNITLINNEMFEKNKNKHRILVVDDSVDTGYSIKEVVYVLTNYFENAEIKTASLNVWDKSKSIFNVDYALYENTIIKAPMSKDSKEHNDFINIYEKGEVQYE